MDAMGNLTQVNEPNPAGGADYITTYTYDVLNHLVGVSMPRPTGTQTRTWVYDTNQRLQSVTNPESGTVTFTYNPSGTMATRIDAKGQRTEYTYDAKMRVSDVAHFVNNLESTCEHVTYGYDSSPYTSFGTGRIASRITGCESTSGKFTEYFSYNAPGGLTNKTLVVRRNGVDRTLSAAIGYDNEGRVIAESYPLGATYNYSFDSQGRPNRLTQGSSYDVVTDVIYGAAGELRQIRYTQDAWDPIDPPVNYATETRQYNSLYQLTRISIFSGMDIEYRYSATQNNGKITQMKNWNTGEEVSYQYDSLQRLSSAVTTGPEWGLSFAYDGFGNRTSQSVTKGSAPTANFSYDLNNRIQGYGYGYDANGNITSMPFPAQTDLSYDSDNRLVTASGEIYAYTPDNKRVYRRLANGAEYFYFYLGNRKLGTYSLGANGFTGQPNIFFMGRRIGPDGTTDRLGSDISGTKYFPFGEEATTTTQDRIKFATYTRDATGLDYADQRYYSSSLGRFLSSDPYAASGGPKDPGSWNRYAYADGDSINRIDPKGLYSCPPMPFCMPAPDCPAFALPGLPGIPDGPGQCDPEPGPGVPQPTGPLTEPELELKCHIEVRFSEAKPFGVSTGQNHTMLVGIDDTSGATLGVIDGGPVLGVSLLNPVPVLTPSVTLNGIYNNASVSESFVTSLSSEAMCDRWNTLEGKARNFPKALYGGLFSNSNSLTSYLWSFVAKPTGPPPGPLATPGWNGFIVWLP
jgi:RHS repeat-associated protein